MLTCQCGLHANVPSRQNRGTFSFLRANVPINAPTCHKACQCFNLACQRAKKRANFSNIPLKKGKFYTLLLYKRFYIILDIIVTHVICVCIVYKNYIIFHLYTSCHVKEKCVEFFYFYYLLRFCFLVRNESIKRPFFLYVTNKGVFSNFPQLKQLNKIKNTCKYCDLLEL